ncbi:hypothetical protein GCM10027167_71780 [Nocardia heshunensis]
MQPISKPPPNPSPGSLDPYPKKPQPNGNYEIEGYSNQKGYGINMTVVVDKDGAIVTAWPHGGQPGVWRRGPDLVLTPNTGE